QLFHLWGWALAILGDDEGARALLFDPDRVDQTDLELTDEMNMAIAEDILGNPNRVSKFALEDDANRGSSRVEDLSSGGRPQFVRGLLDAIERAVDAFRPTRRAGFDPWPA